MGIFTTSIINITTDKTAQDKFVNIILKNDNFGAMSPFRACD